MRRHHVFYVIMFSMAIFLAACSAPPNHPPVIDELRVSSGEVYAGQSVRLQVTASDPDGDPLGVHWTAAQGTIAASNRELTTWTAPDFPGTHFIRVEVSDSQGARVVGTQEIRVKNRVKVPAGTDVLVSLLHPIAGEGARIGDRVPVQVVNTVRVDGFTVIEAGAYGVAQVVRVTTDPAEEAPGSIALVITKVQLADGQVVALDAVDLPEEHSRADDGSVRTINEVGREAGVTGLKSTSFWFQPGELAFIPTGTVFAGTTRTDLEVQVFDTAVIPYTNAKPVEVESYPCLGIEGVNFSEVVLTVYQDGVRVDGFVPGSPAEQSQIQVGDRIVGLRAGDTEYQVMNKIDLDWAVRNVTPGDEVTVLIRNVLRKTDVVVQVGLCYGVP